MSITEKDGKWDSSDTKLALGILVLVLGINTLGMWGCPTYNVWREGLGGKAKLAEAEYSRQILIEEARSKKEAAKMLGEAEVERAKGVAEANKIIGESLQGHEEYLRYLWITGLESGNNRETIYVPTEAGLPILEANRFNRKVEK